MTRALLLGSLLFLTGGAYAAGATGLGHAQPQRQALSVRTGTYHGGGSGSSSRRRGGFFFSGSSGRSSGGGFSFGK